MKAVSDGMELLAWDCFHARWEQHVASERSVQPGNIRDALMLAGVGAAIATGVAGPIIGPLAAGAVVAGGFAFYKLRGRRLQKQPPQLQLTSTGLLFGDQAWLWQWLDADRPPRVIAGYDDDAPCVLELTFARRFRRQTVRIPIPSELVDDARGVVHHLRDRLSGREM